ncbi:hypothetical protein SDC9_78927 [bioreactor metagenome]|uniref:Uncharacterized protein n=1 Tax=bioreactor metagenome TaxID=1076179 RepID=A0A644YUU9_9ZZZZ
MLFQNALNGFAVLGVHHGQAAGRKLDQSEINTPHMEVFHNLKSDKAGADDKTLFCILNIAHEIVEVGHIPKISHIFKVFDSGNSGWTAGSAGCNDELVIRFFKGTCGAHDRHGLLLAVDGGHLMHAPHIHVVHSLHALRGLEQQCLALRNGAGEMIGHSAVCKGDKFSLFKNSDVGVACQSAKTGGNRDAAGNAADDDNIQCLHLQIL